MQGRFPTLLVERAPPRVLAQQRRLEGIGRRIKTIAKLKSYADPIKALGATSLFLFGSTARNEHNSRSDLDLFVDYDHDGEILSPCEFRARILRPVEAGHDDRESYQCAD